MKSGQAFPNLVTNSALREGGSFGPSSSGVGLEIFDDHLQPGLYELPDPPPGLLPGKNTRRLVPLPPRRAQTQAPFRSISDAYLNLTQIPVDSNILSPAAYAEQAIRNRDLTAFSRVNPKTLSVSELRSLSRLLRGEVRISGANSALLAIAKRFKFSAATKLILATQAVQLNDPESVEFFIKGVKNVDYQYLAEKALEAGHTQLATQYTQRYLDRPAEVYEEAQTNFEEYHNLEMLRDKVRNLEALTPAMKEVADKLEKFLDSPIQDADQIKNLLIQVKLTSTNQLRPHENETLEQISDLAGEWLRALDAAGIPLDQYQGEAPYEAGRLWRFLNTINREVTGPTTPAMFNLLEEFDFLKESGQDPRTFDITGLMDSVRMDQLGSEERQLLALIERQLDDYQTSILGFGRHQQDEYTKEGMAELIEVAIRKDNLEYIQSQRAQDGIFLDLGSPKFLLLAAEYSESIYHYLYQEHGYSDTVIDETNILRAIARDDYQTATRGIGALYPRGNVDGKLELTKSFQRLSEAAAKLEDPSIFIYLMAYTKYKSLVHLFDKKISLDVLKYLVDQDLIDMSDISLITDNMSPAILSYFLRHKKNQTKSIYGILYFYAIRQSDNDSVLFLLSIANVIGFSPIGIDIYGLITNVTLMRKHPSLLLKAIDAAEEKIVIDLSLLDAVVLGSGSRDAYIILLWERLQGRVKIEDEDLEQFSRKLQERGYRELAELPAKVEHQYIKGGARM